MDLNKLAWIKIPCSGSWIHGVVNNLITKYHVIAKLWKSGTGGGGPQKITWIKCNMTVLFKIIIQMKGDYFFISSTIFVYVLITQPTLSLLHQRYLCWIYMLDRSRGYVLSTKTKETDPDSNVA